MDPIKEAFAKAKADIQYLKDQIAFLNEETSFLRQTLDDILKEESVERKVDPQGNQGFLRKESVEKDFSFPSGGPVERKVDPQGNLCFLRKESVEKDFSFPSGGPVERKVDPQGNQGFLRKESVEKDFSFPSSKEESVEREPRFSSADRQTNTLIPAQNPENPAFQHTNSSIPAQKPHQYVLKGIKSMVSSGNDGVPADRQTDQQTDQHIHLHTKIGSRTPQEHTFQHLFEISEALETLDQAKKEVRLKFKRLTKQEMEVFSAIYQLEEQGFTVDYPLLAQKLSLTESSIRDYVQKLIKKGSPILKTKENNKKIILQISPDLKKIASLPTIFQLRDI